MKLNRNTYKLLVVSGDGVITDQVGAPLRLQPSTEDNTPDTDQSFGIHAVISNQGDVKAQSVQVKLQTSIDKVTWVDVVQTPHVKMNTTKAFTRDAPSVTLLPWVRAVTVLRGETKPAHKATVWLTSNGPFRCRVE